MDRILLITSRKIEKSGGELALIGNRAEAIYKKFHIQTDALLLRSTVFNEFSEYEGFTYSEYSNDDPEIRIKNALNSKLYRYVIISGDRAYKYMPIVKGAQKTFNIRTYIDLHGALNEIYEYSPIIKKPLRYLYYVVKKLQASKTIKQSDGVFVVTDEMKDSFKTILPERDDFDVFKIRCGIDNTATNNDRISSRSKTRKELGIDKDAFTFVYSGSLDPWQKFDIILEDLKKIDALSENTFYCFFIPQNELINKKLEDSFPRKNYVVKWVDKNKLRQYLCGADVGYLLRNKDTTNKVAFPNKFSDYINAGLILKVSDSLKEPIRLLKSYNVPYIIENKTFDRDYLYDLSNMRSESNIADYYEKCNMLCDNELIYNTQVENELMKMFKV